MHNTLVRSRYFTDIW